jgi:hypothetical protein
MNASPYHCAPRLGLTLISFALTFSAGAADFPQWRGPQRDGHAQESGLLQEWPDAGPKLLWQVTDVGGGYSTPTVVGDRIFLLGSAGSEETVYALAVKDGRRLCRVSNKVGKERAIKVGMDSEDRAME